MITIKYVYLRGELRECSGKLFSFKGYQYCLSNVKGLGWVAHEITTGHLAVYLSDIDNYILKAKDARLKLKELIKKAFKKEGNILEDKMLSAIAENEKLGISYPVNKPISNETKKTNKKSVKSTGE